MNCTVRLGQSIVTADMHGAGDFSNWNLNSLDVALPIEREGYLDTEVDDHRVIATIRMVREKQVVPRAQFLSRFQESPDLIKSRLPGSGDITDSHGGSDGSYQFCAGSFNHNLVFHHRPSV
jgi:hypothetical protein